MGKAEAGAGRKSPTKTGRGHSPAKTPKRSGTKSTPKNKIEKGAAASAAPGKDPRANAAADKTAPAGSATGKTAATTTSGRAGTEGAVQKAKPAERHGEAAAKPAANPGSAASTTLDNSLLPTSKGKIAVFGGPKDRGIKPDDKLALPTGPHSVYERVRSLNPKSYYCAMRWDYRIYQLSPEEGKRWWANKKLVVTNTRNSVSVVVRAVDYGPHENTGFDIGVSPGAAAALGVEVGDDVEIAFADQRDQLGPK